MGKYSNYAQIRGITELPQRSRRALAISRDGDRIKPRKFHLNAAQLDQARATFRDTGSLADVIPFNRGAYYFTILSLFQLGMNQKHKMATVQAKFRELMSDPSTKNAAGDTLWKRFRDKEPATENQETALDWVDRFEQNIRVLQRFGGFTPYGLKLNEIGQKVMRNKGLVIDLLKSGTGELYVRLNSESSRPVNETRVRNVQPRKAPAKRRVSRKAPAADAPASAPAELVTASA